MNRKEVIVAIILTVLMGSLIAGAQNVKVAEADPFLFGVPPLMVDSPPCNPYLSVEPTVNFSFDYYVAKNLTQIDHFTYSLDEHANSTLTSSMSDFNYNIHNDTQTMYSRYSISKTLENLSNGNHSVTFYVHFLNGTIIDIWNETIIVDTTYRYPVPLMISPLNQTTYSTKDVPVTFSVNCMVGESLYSLDSSDWQGMWRNGTLLNLSNGPHTLKIVITIVTQTDNRYVQYRETVYFNVDTNKTTIAPSPSPTPSPSHTSLSSPTQQPTTEPIPSPSSPEFPSWIILPLVLIATISTALIIRKKTTTPKSKGRGLVAKSLL